MWRAWWDSNPRPQPPQGCALSAELQALIINFNLNGAEGGIRTHTPVKGTTS